MPVGVEQRENLSIVRYYDAEEFMAPYSSAFAQGVFLCGWAFWSKVSPHAKVHVQDSGDSLIEVVAVLIARPTRVADSALVFPLPFLKDLRRELVGNAHVINDPVAENAEDDDVGAVVALRKRKRVVSSRAFGRLADDVRKIENRGDATLSNRWE